MGDVSLIYFLQLAWKKLWFLILFMFLFAAAAFSYCNFLATPVYNASSSILVTNGAIVTQYETGPNQTDSISSTDITASLSLANTVIDILKTPDIYLELSEQFDGKYTYSQLKGVIKVERRNNNTLFIDITASSTEGKEAKLIANEFAKASCKYVTKFIPYAKANVASTALNYQLVFPNTITITAIAAMFGVVLAFIIVFIADSLNQSIRGEDDFIAKYNLPLLGAVPDFENNEVFGKYSKKNRYYSGRYSSFSKNKRGNNTAESDTVAKAPPFAVVEAYKTIRSNLMFLLEKTDKGNVVAITSSNAGEGKSTTVVNLAIAFSQLEGKILVIDADMRRSSAHKKLKLPNEHGLSNILAGLDNFEDSVQKISDNFHVLTSGQTPPNPSEMLSSKRFGELVKYARENYDYILIDTPPLNVVSDAIMLAPHTDGFAFVLRDGFTPNFTIKRAFAMLDLTDNKVLGAIMNGAYPKSGTKYIYRKYSYRSRYYNHYHKYGPSNYKNNSNKNYNQH